MNDDTISRAEAAALVAAAYQVAVEATRGHAAAQRDALPSDRIDSVEAIECVAHDIQTNCTPADAQAALDALLRKEYERGYKQALQENGEAELSRDE